ncbi:MAG: polysaccharide deacetylase family protein [Solirubrobacteraceae bacterium]|nr:polysaccharide deacetylase family protein [Patulibacter sp.]
MTQLALTFDDGPDPVWTPRVLERLAAADVHATFFVLGERVQREPAQLEAILAAGHSVGLHGDRHLDHSTADDDVLRRDTDVALSVLARHGVTPSTWRLPWGRRGPITDALAEQHRLHVVPWDLDTHDWRGDGWADQPADTAHRVARGGIVLLHDAVGPGATRAGCVNTLELVDAIISTARDAGVRIGPVDEPRGFHG